MSIEDNCFMWAKNSYRECAEYRDNGYDACDEWAAECCDWRPCSWVCEFISWICIAWYWVSNIVCVVWTTVVTFVCVISEIVSIIIVPIALFLELILSIPIIGRIIREFISILVEIIWRLLEIWDVVLDVLGVLFPKKLRICIVILKDERGNPVSSEKILKPYINDAKKIYDDEARIQLIIQGIYTVDKPAPVYALDVDCGAGAWGDDLWLPGSYFERQLKRCALGGLGRLIGYGAPVTVFAVRDVKNKKGCSLGPLSDYVTVRGQDPICFAHEISHALGLWHVDAPNNLANPICGGKKLKKWQRIIIRNSRHVTYI